MFMATVTSVQNSEARLKKARKAVKTQESNASTERSNAKKNFGGSNVKHWKGTHYDTFERDRDSLYGKYNDWISKWGWGDDGSINGVVDKIDHEIGSLESWLDSFFN
jgi:hypothetical protein